jgi:hypothetical protein
MQFYGNLLLNRGYILELQCGFQNCVVPGEIRTKKKGHWNIHILILIIIRLTMGPTSIISCRFFFMISRALPSKIWQVLFANRISTFRAYSSIDWLLVARNPKRRKIHELEQITHMEKKINPFQAFLWKCSTFIKIVLL